MGMYDDEKRVQKSPRRTQTQRYIDIVIFLNVFACNGGKCVSLYIFVYVSVRVNMCVRCVRWLLI